MLVAVTEFSNLKKMGFLSLIPKRVILWWIENETQNNQLSFHCIESKIQISYKQHLENPNH